MLSRLSTVIDLTPTLVGSWQVVVAAGDRQFVERALLLAIVLLVGWIVAREVRPKATRILILGSGILASRLIDEIESSPDPRYIVVGVVDAQRPDPTQTISRRWLGPCDQFAEIVARARPARVIVALTDRRNHLPLEALLESRVRGVPVDDALDFYERLTGKTAIEAIRPSMLIQSPGFRNHGAFDFASRVFSVAIAAVGLLLAAPLLTVIALAIKVESRGSIFYVCHRAGRYGRPFRLLKLRTMRPCTEHRSEWERDNADRITRVGAWLRRFRLDELPQFINVIRGDMNLIGPRPHPTANHAIFMENIAYYGLRSTVRPGLTGWAQVCYGYANDLNEETEKMRYDLYYIKNRSLWLDLRILFKTPGIVLTRRRTAAARQRPAQASSDAVIYARSTRRTPQPAQ